VATNFVVLFTELICLTHAANVAEGRANVAQWRNDGVAAASSAGGPTGDRGPQQF